MPESPKPSRSFARIAGIVAIATLLSKLFGLVRQQVIAAVFGVGPAFDAYNYAYIVPGFLLILLGGINGPFHSAIVSVLAKRDREDSGPLVETITTLVGLGLLCLTVLLFFLAEPLVNLVAPGLDQTADGLLTKAIAIQQLQIMAPMALLAGLIGIGFGTLNAADLYWLPSVSPLFSSVAILFGLGSFVLLFGLQLPTDPGTTGSVWQGLLASDKLPSTGYAAIGGMVLAGSTLGGAVLQWLVQIPAQWQAGMGRLRFRFEPNRSGVREVFRVMAPATLSSGMLQINVYTDLFFASFIPAAAAAGLGYSGLLVQTPLGILSNMILVPMLPMFSRLADPMHWDELKARIRQGLLLTALTMLPLGAFMIIAAKPIVRVVYERGAFASDASQLVASLLIAYGIGMFVYLARDVLVRVFYALGDGDTPFRISLFNIGLNALLDYLLIREFGAPGLVLATVGVNIFSVILLLWQLDRKLHGIPWLPWGGAIAGLTAGSLIAGGAAWGALWGSEQWLGTEGLGTQLLQLLICGFVGLVVFGAIAYQLRLPELNLMVDRIRQKLLRSG